MAGIQSFEFDPARLEGSFSDLQPVTDPVQHADSSTPGCCGRTRITIASRSLERGYTLELPLHGHQPNETPCDPPQNFQSLVMAAEIPAPMLQLLSHHKGDRVTQVIITASGPSQCPPGIPSHLQIEGSGGGTIPVPQKAWTWAAPAILDPGMIETLDADLISLLHPFKQPHLPAQLWKLSLPHCPASRLTATIATFPDVRWTGSLTLSTRPDTTQNSGYETHLEGDLACIYNDNRWPVLDKALAHALSQWTDCLAPLARTAVAILALRPSARHAGLDNPRLTRLAPFRFDPWPRLTLQFDARLFEQEGNGLLGHALRHSIQADPLIGASGEISLLGPWLEQPDKTPILGPLLAALDVIRAEEIAQEIGLWLVADGHIRLRTSVEAMRPHAATTASSRSHGSLHLGLEARSIRDYDSFIIHQGGTTDPTRPAGFHALCKTNPDTPQSDPREHKPLAAIEFTGLAVTCLEKRRPGCRFRHHPTLLSQDPLSSPPTRGCHLLPERTWPPGATLEAPAPVPWCD